MYKNPNYNAFVKTLKKAMKSIDKEVNPKLYSKADELVRNMSYENLSDFDLALELDTAEPTKTIPREMADLLEVLYLRATEQDERDERGAAYNNLGSLYYHRRAGRRNYKKSIYYYLLADQAGYRLADENLAYCYYYGQGTKVDYERAYYYFSKAAMAGRYQAMYRLGDMFRGGIYVDKDEDMARIAYIKSERMMKEAWDTLTTDGINYGNLYMRLGDMYYEGIGTAQNKEKAYECYQIAERGLYEQIRHGNHYTKENLRHVNARLKELKKLLVKDLPIMDW